MIYAFKIAQGSFRSWGDPVQALLLREWLKKHPELVLQFEVEKDNSVLLLVCNPEKTKILAKFLLNTKQQDNLIARLEGFFI